MTWKIASYNVNGIRARISMLLGWLERNQPDAICLQETKCEDGQLPRAELEAAGYHVRHVGQKAYNGVAILTRRPPDEVFTTFDDGGPEQEARLIGLKTDGLWVINTYIPQGRDPSDPAFQSKLSFFRRVKSLLETRFRADQPLAWTGDLNVAPEALDVFDPKRLDGQVGFHPDERRVFSDTAAWGLIDLFRHLHPGEKQFTFWDYRLPKSLERNLGWRLDHIMVTESLKNLALSCQVDTALRGEQKPSDHTPIWAEFDWPQ